MTFSHLLLLLLEFEALLDVVHGVDGDVPVEADPEQGTSSRRQVQGGPPPAAPGQQPLEEEGGVGVRHHGAVEAAEQFADGVAGGDLGGGAAVSVSLEAERPGKRFAVEKATLKRNKNRLCSNTCGCNSTVLKSNEKKYTQGLRDLFEKSDLFALDPTPKRNLISERRIPPQSEFIVTKFG